MCYKGSDTLIIINEEIDYTIHTSSTTDTGNIASIRATIGARDLDRSLQTLVSNDDSITLFSYSPPLDTLDIAYDYLIITQDSLKDYWCRFAEWKRDLGYKVRVRTVSWITTYYSGTDTTDKIKNYLTTAYTDSGLVYVLLGGSYNNVPGYYAIRSGVARGRQDISYTELFTEDSYDIQVMRIPANIGEEIINWSNKLINYEKYPGYMDSTDYLQWTLFASAKNDGWRNTFADYMNMFADDAALTWDNVKRMEESTEYSCDHYHYGESVIDSINLAGVNNKHICNFSGHGFPERVDINNHHYTSDSLWECRSEIYSDPSVDIGGHHNGFLTELSNEGYPKIMLNWTCGTAMLSPENYPDTMGWVTWDGPTLAEKCLLSEGIGGIAYSGSVIQGMYYMAYTFIRQFLISVNENPQLGTNYFNAMRRWTPYYLNVREDIGMFGDPTMNMWQNFPLERFLYEFYNSDSITVTRIAEGYGSIAVEGIVVSLIDTLGMRYCGITDAGGVVEFEDAAIDLNGRRFARITISGHACPWAHETIYDYLPLVIHGSHSDDYWQPCCEPDSGFYMSGDNALTMDFVIPEDVSLNIEKGSNIWIEADALHDSTNVLNKIEVINKGELTSIGSEGISIEFDIKPDPWHTNEAGDWYGIVIDSSGKVNIRYTEINYPYRGIDVDSSFNITDTVFIENCVIRYPEVAGIRIMNGLYSRIIILDSCIIDSVINYGIHLERIPMPSPTSAYISNNIISGKRSSNTGIYCNICRNIKINNNKLLPDFQTGIYLYECGGDVILMGNDIYSSNEVIHTQESNYISIDSCIIKGCSSRAIGISSYNRSLDNKIRNCIFDSLYIGVYNGSIVNLGDSAASDPGNNSFRKIDRYAVINTYYYTVKAEQNWWGTTNPDTIESKILGSVDFNPYLTSDPNSSWAKGRANGNELPEEFELIGNYPNPFNATTSIKVRLPEPCKIEIEIYNISGRRISNIDVPNGQAGINDILWNGLDDAGRSVASGVYFYVFRASGISNKEYNVKSKMVLIK